MSKLFKTQIRIFIVDDSKLFLIKLRRLLEHISVTKFSNILNIRVSDNPKKAIHELTETRFDIVFVDDVFRESNLSGRDILRVIAPRHTLTAHHMLVSGRKLIARVNPLCSDISTMKQISKCDMNELILCKLIAAAIQRKATVQNKSAVVKEFRRACEQ
jgi:DNA-binding NarL/FixJ family response regulator|tara:strand:+ start:234 stop:710 length:477 start_codon:yes stop_codon:yes gene_type:complete